jgi:protein SCO1/2
MKRKTAILALSCLLLATMIGAAALLLRPTLEPGNVVSSGTALVGGPFEATAHTGERITDKAFLGKYTLYYFGYTYCPDVCPAELQIISAALAQIDDAQEKFNVAFVTVDPERDTAPVMKEYVANFWPGTVGITGSVEDIRKLASAFRVYYAKVEETNGQDDDYLMDHSSIIYLMGPDGKFVRHFPYGTSADELAEALKKESAG